MPLPVEQDMVELPDTTNWERMSDEYRRWDCTPRAISWPIPGEAARASVTSEEVLRQEDGAYVRVAGLVIRRQRPLAKAVFLTLEDEFGHVPLIVWPKTYERLRLVIKELVLLVSGKVTRRDGTLNVIIDSAVPVGAEGARLPRSRDWG
jgi:error-prone DNA polymerase